MLLLRIALVGTLAFTLAGCGGAPQQAEPTPLPRVAVGSGPQADIGALPTTAPPPGLIVETDPDDESGDGGGGVITPTPTPVEPPTVTPPTPTPTPTESRGPGE